MSEIPVALNTAVDIPVTLDTLLEMPVSLDTLPEIPVDLFTVVIVDYSSILLDLADGQILDVSDEVIYVIPS